MNGTDAYRKFQDLIFQEIEARERTATQGAVEQFVQYAKGRGFTIDRLIEMANAGMSGRDVWNAVYSS